jgi:septum formation inhibitor-activating ATPase MinD
MADKVTGEQFSKLLNYLRRIYSYIIVDTASQLTEAVQAALDVADLIVLITTQDIPIDQKRQICSFHWQMHLASAQSYSVCDEPL